MAIQFGRETVRDEYSDINTFGSPTGMSTYRVNTKKSAQATAGNAARAYQGAADDSMAGAVDAARGSLNLAMQGINAIQSGPYGQGINLAMEKLNKNYQLATDAAMGMGQNISQVEASAAALRPYAQDLNQYAATLWNQGGQLFNTGQGLTGTGQSILDMNAAAGGVAGEYVKWLQTIDPNRYVSMAASDVQNSFTNAQGQLNRQLTRAGSDASSTRTAALQQQMAQSLASALAGAKTRARMQGLSDQGKALQSALQQAQSMITQGADIQKAGTGIEGEAGTLKNAAAGVEANAGKLYAEAGSLRASQSSVLTQAGQLMAKYGDLSQNTAQLLVQAYGTATQASTALSKMQAEAGTYYAQVAQGYGSMAGDYLFGGAGSYGGNTRGASSTW